MASFQLERRDENVAILRVTEEVDLTVAEAFEAAVGDAYEDATRVIVDLTAVPYMDSRAIGILVRADKYARKTEQRLIVVLPRRSNLRRVFEIVGMDRRVPMFDSVDEALIGTAPSIS